MVGAEYEEKTRELVVASDKVLFALAQWKGNPTPEHHAALLVAKVEYLESEVSLGVFLRERLEQRVKALEARPAAGGAAKRKSGRRKKRPRK